MPMKNACGVPSHGRTILEICQKRGQTGVWQTPPIAPTAEAKMRSAMASTLRKKCSPGLVDHVDGFLGSLIEGGYRLRICLEGALGHDERRKLGRDVHIGRL